MTRSEAMRGNKSARRRLVTINGVTNHVTGWADELYISAVGLYTGAKVNNISVEEYLRFKCHYPDVKATKAMVQDFLNREVRNK